MFDVTAFHPDHLKDLRNSGLSDETIEAAGLYSVPPRDIRKITAIGRVDSLLAFPYSTEFTRYKVFPTTLKVQGKRFRYTQPTGTDVYPYIPPAARQVIEDATIRLWIVEGEKKALKGCQEGILCLAIGGLWNWLSDGRLAPSFKDIAWQGRLVTLCPDSDVWKPQKTQLREAVRRLGEVLEAEGAQVIVCKLSNGAGETKQGLDDFLCLQTTDDLKALPYLALTDKRFQRKKSQNGANQSAPGGAIDAKPVILINTDITAMVDAMAAAAKQLPGGPFLFQRARQLSHITRTSTPPRWLRRPLDTPLIDPIDPACLRELATRAATWQKYDKRAKQWEDTLPPMFVIETLYARPSWTFPSLEGIVCAPTIRPDGSILSIPGYDVDTGLFLDLNGTRYPAIPKQLTKDDAKEAVKILKAVFVDFPFAADHHRSAALAALLSLVARFAIQGNVPLFAVSSTTRGAGKGLLIDAIHTIATGRVAPPWTQTADEEEERKRLLAIAMAGDAAVHIDNVTQPLGSGTLDSALTKGTVKDRILGQQVSREAPLHTVFFASGNNMIFKGDMARRVVPIDLDPRMEKPEERDDFEHSPLLPWVLQERPTLVVAALMILKAYFDAGSPSQEVNPLGSFEEWSTLVRQALIWTGEDDPCEGRQKIEAESDPEYEALNSLLMAWSDRFRSESRTVKRAIEDLDAYTVYDKEAGREVVDPKWRDIHSALAGLDKQGRINARSIGNALSRWKGRVIGGKCFVTDIKPDRTGAKLWCVESR
jgi:hypothetical protein